MNQSIPKLEDLLAAMPIFAGPVPLEPIASENRKLLKEITSYDPLLIASTFGGLLTVPDLQSNCIRLEILIHCALAFARGQRQPNDKIISRLFARFGRGVAGRYEDPAEDVFVSSIATPRGNFRFLEGVWESAGFHLQRVVNVLESMPSHDRMRERVYALLRLSDAVCQRARLTRYQLGNETPLKAVPEKLLDQQAHCAAS